MKLKWSKQKTKISGYDKNPDRQRKSENEINKKNERERETDRAPAVYAKPQRKTPRERGLVCSLSG